jgi:hypothetical protein
MCPSFGPPSASCLPHHCTHVSFICPSFGHLPPPRVCFFISRCTCSVSACVCTAFQPLRVSLIHCTHVFFISATTSLPHPLHPCASFGHLPLRVCLCLLRTVSQPLSACVCTASHLESASSTAPMCPLFQPPRVCLIPCTHVSFICPSFDPPSASCLLVSVLPLSHLESASSTAPMCPSFGHLPLRVCLCLYCLSATSSQLHMLGVCLYLFCLLATSSQPHPLHPCVLHLATFRLLVSASSSRGAHAQCLLVSVTYCLSATSSQPHLLHPCVLHWATFRLNVCVSVLPLSHLDL